MRAETTPESTYVIGAGIVGACTALHLQAAGRKVVLLEKDAPGSGASSGNAGSIGTASIPPYGMPGLLKKLPRVLLDPLYPLVLRRENLRQSMAWFVKLLAASKMQRVAKIADARASLLTHADTAYDDLLRSVQLQHLIQKTGLIHTYQSKQGLLRAAYAIALRKDRGVKLETLNGDELREIEPMLTDGVEAGIFYPDIGTCFNPGRLNTLLVEAFTKGGGTLVKEEARDFEVDEGRCKSVITSNNRHRCADVILTAGAWSKQLATKLGCTVSLEAERGYHIMVNQLPTPLVMPLVSTDFHVAITPMENEIRMSTMSEFSSISAAGIHERAYSILKQGSNVVRDMDLRPNSRWVGARPSTPDSLPVIGRSRACANVVFAFGHGHLGLTLGSITGKLVTQLCCGTKTTVDLAAFSPYRTFTGAHL